MMSQAGATITGSKRAARASSRPLHIRTVELLIDYGVIAAVAIALWLAAGSLLMPLLAVLLLAAALATALLPVYMPKSCRVEGRRVVMRTPARAIEALLLGEPALVKKGRIPATKAYLCYGHHGLTFNVDCGDDYYFSTPDCDGTWLVAEAEIGRRRERRRLWLCGCARR